MIPSNAPFDAQQQSALNALLSSFSSEQAAWLGGYLTAASSGQTGQAAPTAVSNTKLTILYGTESGNSEALAEKTAKAAKSKGAKVQTLNMSDVKPADLQKAENLLVIVSTWGDGEPPEAAEAFYKAFMEEKVDLAKVKFSICALGDTSYDKFCQTGKDIDTRLEALGAQRVLDRADCDVDFDDTYDVWVSSALEKIIVSTGGADAAPAVGFGGFSAAPAVTYDKKNPFPAEVIESVILNGEGTAKETIHLELDLEGSGLEYESGDALAVVPTNADDVVNPIIELTGFAANTKVELKGEGEVALLDALRSYLDITAVSKAVLKKYNELAANAELTALLADDAKEKLKDWIWGRQIIDVLEAFPVKDLTAQQLVSVMRKLPPRLYSIASSPNAHPGEVHLTVAAVRYNSHGKDRKGVASTFIADEAKVGEKVKVYVHKNKNFRLPSDENTPVIMVGPGTGIAPFRAFIEERGESGNAGGSWLFFGDQKYNFDFLYQLELQDHLKSGALTKLDVAFSRDQPEKVYVQHKIKAQAEEIYAWLEKGAHFYVCGDASRMANDVQEALIEVIQEQGGKTREESEAYIDALKKDKRYQRDVY